MSKRNWRENIDEDYEKSCNWGMKEGADTTEMVTPIILKGHGLPSILTGTESDLGVVGYQTQVRRGVKYNAVIRKY